MTIDEIRELIQVVRETGVAELEVQRGDNRVRIKLGGAVQEYIAMPAAMSPGPAPQPVSAAAAPAAPAVDPANDPNLILVKSPIVGTFYASPSPGAPAFVQAGDRVTPGKVLCIIESMKLMNEIECEVSGTIVARLVESGQPVEYGEALYSVRPS
ncbi:MAG: acetyl-CoA carboxylase biotin carboxyl carrier protein [Acidobacteria bacterium]|nr:acetyl-CoA carboxylase biotin carboxyl carrier protein [Acidobacteriota bacterium]